MKNNKNNILAMTARHDALRGEWPGQGVPDAVRELNPFEPVPGDVSRRWLLDEKGTPDGHNTMVDGNFALFAGVNISTPLSPVFVKDLAGRAVHTGVGPETRRLQEWAAYRAPANDTADSDLEIIFRNLAAVTFPRGCTAVDGRMPGAELLEEVLLTRVRPLDMSVDYTASPSDHDPETPAVAGVYAAANLYPYKLRLDTFYQDGWRLPQTEMVYARQTGVSLDRARARGEDLLRQWEARAEDMDYPRFVESQGGEAWVEAMFRAGCTLVPTFEACNGLAVVGRGFEIEDYWPGRAVAGLHTVAEERADKAPYGTILQVLRPGYVTAATVVPAEVVISDGSGYVSPNGDDPVPQIVNLDLPHCRTTAVWGACWVPTHPGHFEVPALWGWDLETGYFLQNSGPVWDPLHYHYASVQPVLEALEKTRVGAHAPVPEGMRERFHPVVPVRGFDTFDPAAKARRREARSRIFSQVVRAEHADLPEGMGAGVGYHPLPLEYEFELEPFWMPDLHPENRLQGDCPEALQPMICPVARPAVTMRMFMDSLPAEVGEAVWLKDESLLATPAEDPLANYPFLVRYLMPDLPLSNLLTLMKPPLLANVGDDWLALPVAKMWDGVDALETLNELQRDLHSQVWQEHEDSLRLLRVRHRVYRENIWLYTLAWWYGLNWSEMLEMHAAEGGLAAGTGAGGRVAAGLAQAERPQG